MYTQLRKFEANLKGKDWVVGDLHGMHGYLINTLDDLGFDYDNDRLFCVGDLIDRGVDSPDCVRLLKHEVFFSVMGNHEMMMLENDTGTWFGNGGQWWCRESEESREKLYNIVREHCSTVAFEVSHRSGKTFGLVHAQVPRDHREHPPGLVWDPERWTDEYSLQSAVWGRTNIIGALKANAGECAPFSVSGIDMVFQGHTVTREVVQHGNQVWIDTGACFDSGYLTVLCADDYL